MTQETPQIKLHCGDCLNVMRSMEPESVTAIVTDPPYGIRFMGKAWDGADIERQIETQTGGTKPASPAMAAGKYDRSCSSHVAFQVWCEQWATEALRVARPGAMLLAFGGTRTFHRLTCAIEDAGWEIRDCVMWVYGSGFPKSLSVGKAIDKAAGAEREVVGIVTRSGSAGQGKTIHQEGGNKTGVTSITAPATDAAKQWQRKIESAMIEQHGITVKWRREYA